MSRTLDVRDYEAALAVCERDPLSNVFVAARLLEFGPISTGSLLGTDHAGELDSLCWTSANVVPIDADEADLDSYAARLRRHRRRTSSIFGVASQVLPLWARLTKHWGSPRSLRADQPMMVVRTAPVDAGRPIDARVRPARGSELDLVVPAAAHMFTQEIGYPPFVSSDRDYRRSVSNLIRAGQTYVLVQGKRVLFKADIGSLALGVAQIQGVWVAPEVRGHGLAEPAMNAVVQQVMETFAPTVSLYVNHYNTPAVRTYLACGFEQVETFATVIL